MATCSCSCARGVDSVVAMVMKLLGIACASCKAFNKSLIDLRMLAALETKTKFASFHSGVDTALRHIVKVKHAFNGLAKLTVFQICHVDCLQLYSESVCLFQMIFHATCCLLY